MANILTGQHFGTEGNRAKLMAAMDRGLISEPQYKTMSGYDASQEIGLTPLSTFLTSGSYNLGKRIRSPGDFEGKIGPWDSTMLNVQGSKGLGFDKNQYEGIIGLSLESLTTDPTGPYGSNYPSKISQNLDKYSAPAYDFDYPPGIFGEVDDERGTIAFDPNKINEAGMSDMYPFANIPSYLLTKMLPKGLQYLQQKFQKKQGAQNAHEELRNQIENQRAAANQVRQNIQTYGSGDRPNTGMNRPGGGRGQSPTGGDVAGTPFSRGGILGAF